MNISSIKSFLLNKEVWLQTITWTLFFASINVYWSKNWIAKSFMHEAVAPHIAIMVPIIFLLNVYWLIPKFLNKKRWLRYIWLSFSLGIGFEIIRALVFTLVLKENSSFIEMYKDELFGENSLIFGFLNVLIFHVIFYSFVYRFTRDWLINQTIIETLTFKNQELQFNSLQMAGDTRLNLSNNNYPIESSSRSFKKTLVVKKRNGIFILKVEDILYFQAQGDFVFAFDNSNNKHIVNESLKTIREQVSEDLFFQINRSELVNFNYIAKFNSFTKNRLEISLSNSNSLVYTSNSRTPEFRLWVEQH